MQWEEQTVDDNRRTQLVCDDEVQGTLMWQAIQYWFFCLLTIALFMVCWAATMTMPGQPIIAVFNELWRQFAPAMAASVIVLPLIVLDVFRQSNRFAGPIFRLRTALQQLAAGEEVRPIHLRDGDMLQELAEDFNRALERLQDVQASENAALIVSPSGESSEAIELAEQSPVVAMLAEPAVAAAVAESWNPTPVPPAAKPAIVFPSQLFRDEALDLPTMSGARR